MACIKDKNSFVCSGPLDKEKHFKFITDTFDKKHKQTIKQNPVRYENQLHHLSLAQGLRCQSISGRVLASLGDFQSHQFLKSYITICVSVVTVWGQGPKLLCCKIQSAGIDQENPIVLTDASEGSAPETDRCKCGWSMERIVVPLLFSYLYFFY